MNLPMLKGKPVIRCSSLDQLLSCPGSRTLLALVGAVRDDDAESWEGQWCHWEAARRLIADHGAVGPGGGLPAPRIPKDYEPSVYARWIVDFYVRNVLLSAGADRAIEVESEMMVEFDGFWLSGHCDEDSVDSACTDVDFCDLKTGINPVDAAESNWQVYGYAVLFKAQWPSLRRVRGRIIQPRITEDVGERITEVVLEGARLEGAAAFLEARITAALQNSNLLRTGIKQCRWCDAWLKCPAIDEEIKEMKQVILTEKLLERIKAEPDDVALARVCVARKLLDSKFESAAKMMKARLETEKILTLEDGTRLFLEEKPGQRQIVDVAKAWEVLAETVEPELAYGCLSIGVEDAEKALAKHYKIPHKSEKQGRQDGRQVFASMLGHTVQRKPQQWLQIVSG